MKIAAATAVGVMAGLLAGHLVWDEDPAPPARVFSPSAFGYVVYKSPPVVAPMPHAWQVLVVPPSHGNPSNDVAFGATVGDALRAAAENGTDYRRDYSPWIAGKPCTGTGVRMACKAVRNPERAP